MTVRIKPLVWKLDGTTHSARTKIGEYRVADIHGEWVWFFAWMPDSVTDKITKGRAKPNTVESAKSAAQADYDTRILSAIRQPTPVDQITVAMALPAVREIIAWLTRETIDIETGDPLFDDAHIDVTAGEVRRRLALFGKATE